MKLINHFFIGKYKCSDDECNKLNILILLSWILTVGGFIFVLVLNAKILHGHEQIKYIQLTLMSLTGLTPFIFKITKNISITTNYFILSFLLILLNTILVTGGIESPGILWIPAIPLVSSSLTDKKTTMYWIFAILIFCGAILIMDLNQLKLTNILTDSQHLKHVRFRLVFSVTIFVGITSYLLRQRIDNSMRSITDKKQQIQQLLRVVSHDIVNPLTIVMSLSKLESKKLDAPDPKNSYSKINRAANTINDILNYIRQLELVSEGKSAIELEAVSLDEVVKNSEFVFHEKFKAKNIKFEYEKTGLSALAEYTSLSNLIFSNLISNAIKFSKEGGTITTVVKEENDLIRISVSDHGIGMKKELADRVFDPFVKTSRKGTSGESGTGFGMPITKTMVERFDGQIYVESKTLEEFPHDCGTTFHILLKKVS